MLSREQLLERQVGLLEAANLQLQQELTLRAMPTLSELIDALENVTRGAQAGNPAAKGMLAKLKQALDAARDAASPLEVIRTGG